MAAPLFTDALVAACPRFAQLKKDCGLAPTVSAADRMAATHGLHCDTCAPIVDRISSEFSRKVRQLEMECAGIWREHDETRPVDTVNTAGGLL